MEGGHCCETQGQNLKTFKVSEEDDLGIAYLKGTIEGRKLALNQDMNLNETMDKVEAAIELAKFIVARYNISFKDVFDQELGILLWERGETSVKLIERVFKEKGSSRKQTSYRTPLKSIEKKKTPLKSQKSSPKNHPSSNKENNFQYENLTSRLIRLSSSLLKGKFMGNESPGNRLAPISEFTV